MTELLTETGWSDLLETALKAIDSLEPPAHWSWGGGTALALQLDHRISYDIDIFLTRGDDLKRLYPRNNPTVKALCKKWQQPGNYLKLEYDIGEIDFIIALTMTAPATVPYLWKGQTLPMETIAEILAKKLHYRGSRALARDVFDLNAARVLEPDFFNQAIAAEPEGAARMADELIARAKRIMRELEQAVTPTETGMALLDFDPLELASYLKT